jgi:KDO2-lipid IV(A) lauroyltransferase
MPFFVIYFLSDVSAFLMGQIIGYRKKIIYQNLKKSFPQKSDKEIKKIIKKYYLHLTDITFESLKGYSLKKEKLLKRFKIINPEVGNNFFTENQSIIYASGHYGNWEWGTKAAPELLLHDVFIMYKPMKNKRIDKYINKLRSDDKAQMISIYFTGKSFLKQTKPYCIIMIGDQNPSSGRTAIWVDFLNQPTACLHGIELYAKKMNFPVVYFVIKKVKRGYYELHFDLLTKSPRETAKGEITQAYMKKLEQDIIDAPEFWLWSHRRWKRKPPENKK